MPKEGQNLGIAFGAIMTSIALVALVLGALERPRNKRR